MDDAGITSISTPGVHMGDDSAARTCPPRERALPELIQKRFGGFAALPLPDVDGALRALEYGLDVLTLEVSYSSAPRAASVSAMRDSGRFSTNWKGAKLSSSCTEPRAQIPPRVTAGFTDRFHYLIRRGRWRNRTMEIPSRAPRALDIFVSDLALDSDLEIDFGRPG
jgi:hypothetical protein